MKTGTLKELNVKPGDVVELTRSPVEWVSDGTKYTIYSQDTYDGRHNSKGKLWAEREDCMWVGLNCNWTFTLISRATETPTLEDDNPKLWRDMTPEEKGALLLAHHEGKEIEIMSEKWVTANKPTFHDVYAYRIKPEPKVEVVTMSGHLFNNEWYFETHRKDVRPTHRITFNTIDGKPDPASIKMTAL